MWCLDNDENIKWAAASHDFPSKRITGFVPAGPLNIWFSPKIKKYAIKNANGFFDIVHQHGIWTGVSLATLSFSQKKKDTNNHCTSWFIESMGTQSFTVEKKNCSCSL